MAKLKGPHLLKNTSGQSLVEYLFLLVIVSTLAFSVLNNKKFKEFIGPNSSYFNALRKGMEYSYRYGRELNVQTNYEQAMEYQYQSNSHDTYLNKQENQSRFFSGTVEYGQ